MGGSIRRLHSNSGRAKDWYGPSKSPGGDSTYYGAFGTRLGKS